MASPASSKRQATGRRIDDSAMDACLIAAGQRAGTTRWRRRTLVAWAKAMGRTGPQPCSRPTKKGGRQKSRPGRAKDQWSAAEALSKTKNRWPWERVRPGRRLRTEGQAAADGRFAPRRRWRRHHAKAGAMAVQRSRTRRQRCGRRISARPGVLAAVTAEDVRLQAGRRRDPRARRPADGSGRAGRRPSSHLRYRARLDTRHQRDPGDGRVADR